MLDSHWPGLKAEPLMGHPAAGTKWETTTRTSVTEEQ